MNACPARLAPITEDDCERYIMVPELRRFAPSVFVVFLCCVVEVSLFLFSRKSETLLLEAGDMFSTKAALADCSWDESLSLLPDLGSDARVWAVLDDGTRVFAANDPSEVALPIHDGGGFTGSGDEALVGSEVRTQTDSTGARWYFLNTKRYRVVGVLGLSDDSVLSDEVVVWDERIGGADVMPVVLDGDDVSSCLEVNAPQVRVSPLGNGSFAQRSSLDSLTPLVLALGRVLEVVLAASAGSLLVRRCSDYLAVCWIVGKDRLGTVLLFHGAMILASLAIAIVCGIVCCALCGKAPGLFCMVAFVLVPLLVSSAICAREEAG